jgi:23S rRNA (uracil1939-C5)-methyltransferase
VSFEFSPIKLIYGGDALGYHAGRTVLVPRVLPGEQVEVEEIRTAKGVIHARPLRILEASPERIEPPCPYFGRCGGCQYQHFNLERQAAAKREILRETLRRLGRINWEAEIPLHRGPAWNYRNQAQLKVTRGADGQAVVGFFEAESHRVLPVDACLILSPRLNAILGELRSAPWASRLARQPTGWEIELLADDRDAKVMAVLRGCWGPPFDKLTPRLSPACAGRPGALSKVEGQTRDEALGRDCLAGLPGVVAVAIEGEKHFQVFGEPAIVYGVGEFRYRISPGSFFQTNRFLVQELTAAVTQRESGPPGQSGSTAVDLFAGVGLFSLPLARRFAQVVSVEAQEQSAADLAANAQAHGMNNVRAVAQSVSDFLRRCALREPDLVVLDPPRAGVGINALRLLLRLRPKRLCYVSCSPPTLARDLRFLLDHGYELNSVEFFDFFPQTYHIESFATLSRSDLAPS